jgi:hypothetical protein
MHILRPMTGASIVRLESGREVVLAVHGAFDGASAWSLRIAMDESTETSFVVDLTHAEEAWEFAASLLSSWARQWSRVKRVRFRPGSLQHERLLVAHGLELVGAEDELDLAPAHADVWPVTGSGATV